MLGAVLKCQVERDTQHGLSRPSGPPPIDHIKPSPILVVVCLLMVALLCVVGSFELDGHRCEVLAGDVFEATACTDDSGPAPAQTRPFHDR